MLKRSSCCKNKTVFFLIWRNDICKTYSVPILINCFCELLNNCALKRFRFIFYMRKSNVYKEKCCNFFPFMNLEQLRKRFFAAHFSIGMNMYWEANTNWVKRNICSNCSKRLLQPQQSAIATKKRNLIGMDNACNNNSKTDGPREKGKFLL